MITTLNGEVVPISQLPEVQAWPWTRTVPGIETPAGHTLISDSMENWIASLGEEDFERDIPSLTLEAMCERDFPGTDWTPNLIRERSLLVAEEFLREYRVAEEVENSYMEVATELLLIVTGKQIGRAHV